MTARRIRWRCVAGGRGAMSADMRTLLFLVITCALVTPARAGSVSQKDPFIKQEQQQRESRHADMREREENEERKQEMQEQRELEHPEMMYDDRDEDLDN